MASYARALMQRLRRSDGEQAQAQALARLARDRPKQRPAIVAARGVPALLQRLRSSSVAVQEAACQALVFLNEANSIGETLVAAGGIAALVQCLGSSSAGVQTLRRPHLHS